MAADPEALRRSLGLKPRRSSAGAGPGRESPRTAPDGSGGEDEVEDEDAVAEAEPITDPVKKPVGKLPPEAQLLLRRFYMTRPEIDLPPHLHTLQGTWGRYFGDGRPDREIQVGFVPAFVLFACPLYPNGGPKWVTKKGSKAEGEMVDPGLHDQPVYTERGFISPLACNKVNEAGIYIVWKSDGSVPVAAAKEESAPANESPRDARRRAQVEKRKKDLEERRKRAAARRR
jgi:hypothetical protein